MSYWCKVHHQGGTIEYFLAHLLKEHPEDFKKVKRIMNEATEIDYMQKECDIVRICYYFEGLVEEMEI